MAKRRNQKLAKEAKLAARKAPKSRGKPLGPGSFRAPKRKAERSAAGDTKRAKAERPTKSDPSVFGKGKKSENMVSVSSNQGDTHGPERQVRSKGKKKITDGVSKHKKMKSGGEAKLKKSEVKARLRAHKCVIKKNFGLVQEVVLLWEKLRPANVTASQKSKLVRLVLAKTKGKIAELVKNHRASRVVQFCLKEGSQIEQMQIMQEVKDNILDLSKIKYGRHLVLKLINYLPEEHMESLVKLFKGHIMTLLKHNYGADVVADLYHNANENDKFSMLLECYGKEISLQQQVIFEADDSVKEATSGIRSQESQQSLENVLSYLDQIQRVSIFRGLTHNINYVLEKGLLHPHLVHILLMEYLQNAPTALVNDLVNTISETGDGVMKMLHTREGAAAACMVLAYGSSKVRKMVIRGFKDYVKDVATDEWGYIVIVAMFGVVDDTTLLNKVIVKGLQSNLLDVCMSQFGSRVILKLLNPDCNDYIPQKVMKLTAPKERIVMTIVPNQEAGEGAVERAGDGIAAREDKALGLSLKDESTRVQSLLLDGQKSLADDVVELCLSSTQSLLKSQFGANILFEVACGGGGPFEAFLKERYREVHKAIIEEFIESNHEDEEEDNVDSNENTKALITESSMCCEDDDSSEPSSAQADTEEESALDSAEESEEEQGDVEEMGDELVEQTSKAHAEDGAAPTKRNQMFRSWNAQNTISRIVELISASEDHGPALEFATLLWNQVFKGRCRTFVGKPGEVVLACLLSHSRGPLSDEVKDELSALHNESLQNWLSKMLKVRELHRVDLHKKRRKRKRRKISSED